MIIVKKIPLILWEKILAHEFWEILAEIPQRLGTMNVQVFVLGVGCVALLFILAAVPSKLLKIMPPPVWAFVIGTVASLMFLNVGAENLITIPESPLKHGVALP